MVYVNNKGEEKFYKDVCHKFYDEYKDENVSQNRYLFIAGMTLYDFTDLQSKRSKAN